MPADDFRKIILARMHELLKPMGFRKTRTLFSADVTDVVLFIHLQASRMSTKDMLKVTVNLGIFSRTVAERLRNTQEPNVYEAHWRYRIGAFLTFPRDKWWEVHSEAEAERCATKITSILAQKALPEMQRAASTESLKALWETGNCTGQNDFLRRQYLDALSGSAPT